MSPVLLSVEDNDAEYCVIRMAVEQSGTQVNICRVADGEKAIYFLERSHGFEDAPRPDVVLLDINLPRKNSFEVLEEVRRHEALKSILIVVFTSTAGRAERNTALLLGADDFISKPHNLSELVTAVQSVCLRYFSVR